MLPGAPPLFTTDLPSRALAPGASIVLTSPGTASEPVRHQWTKDGADLPGATAATLTVAQFQPSDAGAYRVTVTNSFGSVTSGPGELANLAAAPVVIKRQPASVSEYAGGNALLYAEVANAGATFRWLKDGAPLSETPGRIIGSHASVLEVRSLTKSDTGFYTLEVAAGGEVARSSTARINVLDAPRPVILTHPAAHTVTAGAVVELTVRMRYPFSNPSQPAVPDPYTYQWLKDGTSIPGQTRATMTFIAQTSTTGRYAVRVGSDMGETVSEGAMVTIPSTPVLFRQHPPSTAFETANAEQTRLERIGFEVVLRRQLNGLPFTWRRNGQTVPNPVGLDAAALRGTYTVLVTSGTLVQESEPFTLDVAPAIVPVIARHPAGLAVAPGEWAVFTPAISTYGEATFQWFRNGEPIALGGNRDSLTVGDVRSADTGDYRLAVTTTAGTTLSEAAGLDVQGFVGLLIREHPRGLTTTVGQPVVLTVGTRGGALRLQWLKDGTPIPGATNAALTLASNEASTGTYATRVTDVFETATSRSVAVRVLGTTRPPEILVQPVSQTAALGEDVTFAVGAHGEPLPERYQWTKDGVVIAGATAAKLRLRAVDAAAAGRYRVTAFNRLGSALSEAATLTIDPTGRMINLATRAWVGRNTDVLICGFVVAGTEPRSMLVRAVGGQLRDFGVAGVLQNPQVRLFDGRGRLVAANDDWTSSQARGQLETAARSAGAFALRDETNDGALLATLAPGAYTAQVLGVADTTGVALVEVYQLGPPANHGLVNLSTRAWVGTGATC